MPTYYPQSTIESVNFALNLNRQVPNNNATSGAGLNNPNNSINMFKWLKDALEIIGYPIPPVTSNSFSRIEQMGGFVEADVPNDTLYLVGGNNVTLDYYTDDDAIVINSTAGPAFGYVSVDGQSDINATIPYDQLVFEGIDGITITTNPGGKAVQIALGIAPALYSFKTIYPSLGEAVIAETAEAAYQLYGTGLTTVTGDNTSKTITIDTPIPDIFKTIYVSGQDDIIADGLTDSFTLVAGTGMTITTDNTTNSITFNSSGSSDTNIYNTDGTLTGNRVLSLNGYNLDFAYDSTNELYASFHTDAFSIGSGTVGGNDTWNILGTHIGAGALTLSRSGTGWTSTITQLSPSGNDPSIDINISPSGGLGTHITDRLMTKNSIIDSVYDGTNFINNSLLNNGSYTRGSFTWSNGTTQAEIGVDAGLGSIFWTKTPLYTATSKVGMVLSSIDSGSTTATAKPTYPVTWTDLRWGIDDSATVNVADYTVNRLVTDADGASRRLVSVLVAVQDLSGGGESIELTIVDETGTAIWDVAGIDTNAAHVQEYTVGVNLAAHKIYRGQFKARSTPGALSAKGLSVTLKTM